MDSISVSMAEWNILFLVICLGLESCTRILFLLHQCLMSERKSRNDLNGACRFLCGLARACLCSWRWRKGRRMQRQALPSKFGAASYNICRRKIVQGSKRIRIFLCKVAKSMFAELKKRQQGKSVAASCTRSLQQQAKASYFPSPRQRRVSVCRGR